MGWRLEPLLTLHKHQDVLHWLNELMIHVKVLMSAGHPPLVPPYDLSLWQARLRAELDCKDWHRSARSNGDLYELHYSAIEMIDAFVNDLTAVWEKRAPETAFDERRIAQMDRIYGNIEQCRESPIKY